MKGCAMTISKLDQLTKKREELNARIQVLKAKENQKKRKEDTKRKILIGGVIMKMLKTGEMPQERLNQLLDKHLERTMDRELFKI
jgi:hypothetical protein